MQLQHAVEIVNLYFDSKKMDAIKFLRYETSLGLIEAKNYLEEHSTSKDALLNQIRLDFVMSVEDLLIKAIAERDQLNRYIEDLQSQLEE